MALLLSATGFNMYVGVSKAGYSISEKFSIMLFLFLLPAVALLILKWKILYP